MHQERKQEGGFNDIEGQRMEKREFRGQPKVAARNVR